MRLAGLRARIAPAHAAELVACRVKARVILDLREMPPEQRQLTLNSPAFRAQFSDDERTMLSTLLTVEPYAPRTYVPAPAP